MAGIVLPLLSEYDPIASSEGALDPLGLYAIADNLAMRLVPGVRERMLHPRYLTCIAAGSIVTRSFEDEVVAADGKSAPWMVYEWYVVEGLVRSRGNDPNLKELPGIQKARDSIKDGVGLSANRYLKTAHVFGFHGIYRLLADDLDIVRDGFLGETGYRLLTTWEREQGLAGFISGNEGPGYILRQQLVDAVADGIGKGATSRSGAWRGWRAIANHFFPNEIPPLEARVLLEALYSDTYSSRKQVMSSLSSGEGERVWSETGSERRFHEVLYNHVDSETKALLDTISAYEHFSRLLQNAFDDCLFALTQKRGKVSPKELSKEKGCIEARSRIRDLYQEVAERLESYNLTMRFESSFSCFSEPMGSEQWILALMDHHERIQRNKPPQGKNPWLERYDDGSFIIRPEYRRSEPAHYDDSYLHTYRTAPLYSFLIDLRATRSGAIHE